MLTNDACIISKPIFAEGGALIGSLSLLLPLDVSFSIHGESAVTAIGSDW